MVEKGQMALYLQLGNETCDFLTFNLEDAVCNHGFFMMAPNLWIPSTKTLQRPLRLSNSTDSVTVSITSSTACPHNSLLIRVHDTAQLSAADQKVILEQVERMLRISEKDEMDVREFQKMHPQAKEKGFGRLFRSPTLFEDLVKTILLCNCTWKRSMSMALALCELQSQLNKDLNSHTQTREKHQKRKRGKTMWSEADNCECNNLVQGNFPSPKELAGLDEAFLNKYCNLGYRAQTILTLAKKIESGKLKLAKLEQYSSGETYKDVCRKVEKIKGFGSFACSNAMMCIGFYQKIPIDTETIRHMKEVHGKKFCDTKTVKRDVQDIYGKYARFQCLAYWFELVEYYENKIGKLSELPHSSYHTVAGSVI